MRDIFILNEVQAQNKTYFYALCLVEIFYLSVSTGTGSRLQAAHFVAG
jgi:hypothetical protein